MKNLLIFLTTALTIATLSFSLPQQNKVEQHHNDPIEFQVLTRLFEQECRLKKERMICQLPEVRKDPVYHSFFLEAPENPGELVKKDFEVSHHSLKAKLNIIRVRKSEHTPVPESYITFQISLFNNQVPIASCSQLLSLPEKKTFPAGACTGVIQKGKDYQRIGVSFHKPYQHNPLK